MRKEQIQRYIQYFRSYIRHGTITKLVNLIRIEKRLLFNNPDLRGLYPYFLIIDPSNTCNLTCPLCQMGLRQNIPRKNYMSLSHYRSLLAPIKNYIFQVFLFNWSEPFLNKDIYRIISFNTENNIGTAISTNANIPINPAELIASGLDYLIISADGIDQEVYEKYRRGGKISLVFENLASIVAEKKRRKSRLPLIEWQSLVTKYNEDHLDRIKKIALERGADVVRFGNLNFYSVANQVDKEREWLPKNPQYNQLASSAAPETRKNRARIRKPCFWLWRSCIVNADGGITPCCLFDIPQWGDGLQEGLLGVWNNALYQEARKRSQKHSKKKNRLICDQCTAAFIYKRGT